MHYFKNYVKDAFNKKESYIDFITYTSSHMLYFFVIKYDPFKTLV